LVAVDITSFTATMASFTTTTTEASSTAVEASFSAVKASSYFTALATSSMATFGVDPWLVVAISIRQPTLSDTTIIKAGSVPFAGFISKAGSNSNKKLNQNQNLLSLFFLD